VYLCFFRADWLVHKEFKKALPFFKKFLNMPDRPVYSKRCKVEAAEKLAKVKKKLHMK